MLCAGEMKRPQPRGLEMPAGDITEDVELIEGLEETKRIATDIEARSALAKETQVRWRLCVFPSRDLKSNQQQRCWCPGDLGASCFGGHVSNNGSHEHRSFPRNKSGRGYRC